MFLSLTLVDKTTAMSSHSTDLSIINKTSVKFASWVARVTFGHTHQYTYTAKRTAANVAVHKCDELEPKPGSKLNVVSEAGPVKDAPTIDASQLDASRNSDHHALTILPCCLCPYAHAPDHALALMSISLLTMPGCRWTDGINL